MVEGSVEPWEPVLPPTGVPPVIAKVAEESQEQLRGPVVQRPGEHGEQVGEFGVERGQGRHALSAAKIGRRLPREPPAPFREAQPDGVGVGVFGLPLGGVLAHGLEHGQTLAVAYQQLFGDQGVERVERCVGHSLGHRDTRARWEDRHPGERQALGVGEQVEAPVDRGAKRALAVGGVSRSAHEHAERMIEASGEIRWRQQPNACGGELQRERQPVQPPADLGDVRGVVLIDDEVRGAGSGAVDEHRHRGETLELNRRARSRDAGHRERADREEALGR